MAGIDLADGASRRAELRRLVPKDASGSGVGDRLRVAGREGDDVPGVATQIVQAFKAEAVMLYRETDEPFEDLRIVRAFRNAAKGFADGKPVHYPRAAAHDLEDTQAVPPDPEGKNFEWFVQNERTGRHALDALWRPQGLPMLREREPRANRPARRQHRP
ncbi:MAG: hypothetical protein M5U07_16650 [Xanthobacteraceae bacterium]|nr:hypothetical protein [Xanthobacteraceae bacterium]